ncbi:hypothetical protein BKA61DRAFT_567648 [Leptodontidium sp. MPI-SDFR-AT-0119]|nr:hypothetical protein BKA61DRAFT_567648 [Leptodontidium sp. MPI-SDFR-AT-0119]
MSSTAALVSSQNQWDGVSGLAAGKQPDVHGGIGGDAPGPSSWQDHDEIDVHGGSEGDAPGPSSWQDPDEMDVDEGHDRGGAYLVVRVTRIPHIARLDVRGRNRNTTKLDWTKIKYDGKTAWLYEGKKQKYVTHDKIPT